MSVNTVSVLGTLYSIETRAYADDPNFEKHGFAGYCDADLKRIVLLDLKTQEDWKEESDERICANTKMTLRHEIVHAFFNESGLQDNSGTFDGPWAQYEEMIDWWAIQGPKVYAAWKEADAI